MNRLPASRGYVTEPQGTASCPRVHVPTHWSLAQTPRHSRGQPDSRVQSRVSSLVLTISTPVLEAPFNWGQTYDLCISLSSPVGKVDPRCKEARAQCSVVLIFILSINHRALDQSRYILRVVVKSGAQLLMYKIYFPCCTKCLE